MLSLDPVVQKIRVQVIVVDNASTDGAPELVEREFPWVMLIRNRVNVGFARANNQAAAHARGRYLFFLNNDTELPQRALRRLLVFARQHPEAGIIGPRLVDGRGRTQLTCRAQPTVAALLHRTMTFRWTGLFRRAYRLYRGRDREAGKVRSVEVLMGAAMLMSRRLFKECGGWDEGFTFGGEDIELCQRVRRTNPVLYNPAVTILHHGSVSSKRHVGYAYANTIIGITHSLRTAGCSPMALLFYKLIFTVEAPLKGLGFVVQYLWQRLRGRTMQAGRSRRALKGISHFLTRGLLAFWRA